MSFAINRKTTAPAKAAAIRLLGILAVSLASAGIAHAAPGLTRAQVQAQLVAAERTGDIVEPWTQLKLNDLYASDYPAKAAASASNQSRESAIRADSLGEADQIKE
jgi:hypothetical protein